MVKVKYHQNLIISSGTITHIPTNLHQFLISSFQLVRGDTHGIHTLTDRTKNNTTIFLLADAHGNKIIAVILSHI